MQKMVFSFSFSIPLIAVILQISGCASFENHKGERFPFSIQVIQAKRPSPTVLVSHGGSCRLPQEEMWAQRFKEWGYNAVIIDHCSQRNIQPHTGMAVTPLTPSDRVNDYIAVAEWVKTQSWHEGKVAVFGISRGGEAVVRAADERFNRGRRGAEGLAELDVYVALYPACGSFPKTPRGPLLVMHGEADNLSFFAACEYGQLNHPNYEIKTYPNAHHGFDVPGADVVKSSKDIASFVAARYDAKAAAQSFQDTRAFLMKHLQSN